MRKRVADLLHCLCAVFLAALLSAGCATTPPVSGFLPDYSKLQTDSQNKSMKWWEKHGVNWKRYNKLMIDPVVIYFHPEAKNRQIEPDVLRELTHEFRNIVIDRVQDTYPVVNEPGPDVLRIRAAITDLIPANPIVNIITTAGLLVPVDMGGASMEAMFLDSTTNELLGAVIDSKKGSPMDLNVLKGFTSWGYAKGAFREWADLLKESLHSDTKSIN